jgi:DNA repair protein RecN (Recombination protein N)
MLVSLTIRNFVLVEYAELSVKQGLTVLTGETGAGKSLLLDALGAVLGDKAQPFWVRPQTDKAEVTAEFALHNHTHTMAWLDEHDLASDDAQCLIRRVISQDGRSKAYINGTSVTLTQLRQLAETLIELHSQHEHHALLQASTQLQLLDTWSQNDPLKQPVRHAYQQWQQAVQARDKRLASEQQRQERINLLSFQAEELSSINICEGDYEQLSAEHLRLAHAQEIIQGLQQTQSLLENDRTGVIAQLTQGLKQLEHIAQHDDISSLIAQYQATLTELMDIQDQLHQRSRRCVVDDDRLTLLEAQLGDIHRLAKKYFVAPEALWQKVAMVQSELSELQQQGETIEQLNTLCETALQTYQQAAEALSTQRQQKAPLFTKLVMQQLHELGMTHSQLAWQFTTHEQPQANGQDGAELYFSANPGQSLYPMSKVASGGELARISLAIEVCVAEQIALPTLVFDEVDVGVGGGIADSIGQKLASIAKHKQVLCITHQAQVAAWGDQHWHIAKQTDGAQTITQVTALDTAARVQELARMLGTQDNTQETIAHAQQMLTRALNKKL